MVGVSKAVALDSKKVQASERRAAPEAHESTDFYASAGHGLSAAAFLYYKSDESVQQSLWHDLQLCVPGTECFNFVVEVSNGTLCKGEVTLEKAFNPVEKNEKATEKLGKFGKKVPMNYGIFPRTYCHPQEKELSFGGDVAPLDVVELSGEFLEVGSIHEVQVLGAFCVIDKSELDWKVFVLRSEVMDSLRKSGELVLGAKIVQEADAAMQWFFDWYDFKGKASGKVTKFPYGRNIESKETAIEVVQKAHRGWLRLMDESPDNIWLSQKAKQNLEATKQEVSKEGEEEGQPRKKTKTEAK